VTCQEANELTIHIMSAFAEHEAKRGSQRTRDALAAAKARGVKLGTTGSANLRRNIGERQQAADAYARKMGGMVEGMTLRGLSQRAMVEELNATGLAAPRGGSWSLLQLQRLLSRIQASAEATKHSPALCERS
jgi:DNA invertase Pin-like site-specific DNA recombinase